MTKKTLIFFTVMGYWSLSQHALGENRFHPVTGLSEKFTLKILPTGSLEFLFHQYCMFLHCGRKTHTGMERRCSYEPKLLYENNRSGTSSYQTILCFPICHRQISFQSPRAEGRDVYSKVLLYFFCHSTSNKP